MSGSRTRAPPLPRSPDPVAFGVEGVISKFLGVATIPMEDHEPRARPRRLKRRTCVYAFVGKREIQGLEIRFKLPGVTAPAFPPQRDPTQVFERGEAGPRPFHRSHILPGLRHIRIRVYLGAPVTGRTRLRPPAFSEKHQFPLPPPPPGLSLSILPWRGRRETREAKVSRRRQLIITRA
jgi:hypothetical protein